MRFNFLVFWSFQNSLVNFSFLVLGLHWVYYTENMPTVHFPAFQNFPTFIDFCLNFSIRNFLLSSFSKLPCFGSPCHFHRQFSIPEAFHFHDQCLGCFHAEAFLVIFSSTRCQLVDCNFSSFSFNSYSAKQSVASSSTTRLLPYSQITI